MDVSIAPQATGIFFNDTHLISVPKAASATNSVKDMQSFYSFFRNIAFGHCLSDFLCKDQEIW